MKIIFSLVASMLISLTGFCQSENPDNEFLIKILTADNITGQQEVENYRSAFNKILLDAKDETDPEDDEYDRNEELFDLLQHNYMKKYTQNSRFKDLLMNGEFNCITSVMLYYLLSTELGLKTNIYESPFHVYVTAFKKNGDEYIIELTDPFQGFDYEWNKDNFVEDLVKYKVITQEELDKKGTQNIYSEYIAKSHKINPDILLADYYSNLSIYSLDDNNYPEACSLMKKAVMINPDSVTSYKYNLVWYLYAVDIDKDNDSLTAFLLSTLDTIPSADDFRESMISVSSKAIYNSLAKNNFTMADSVYKKLCSVLPKEELSDARIQRMEKEIISREIQSKAIRGENEEAFNLASDLLAKYPGDQNILDYYVNTGNAYLGRLSMIGDFDKMKSVADSLIAKAPDIKSVKDNYVLLSVSMVMTSGLYRSDSRLSESILLDAYKIEPDNFSLKKALAEVYHELGMAEIRNTRNYKKAVSILQEGLKYDPENYDLKHEIELTKELIK